MKRRYLLIAALAALVTLSAAWLEWELALIRAGLEQAEREIASLRSASEGVKQGEEALRSRQERLNRLSGRPVEGDPLQGVWQALMRHAAAAGITLEQVEIEQGEPVKDVPGLVRYRATVAVAGTHEQFVRFLGELERSERMVAIPDLALTLHRSGLAVRTTVELGFFGKADR